MIEFIDIKSQYTRIKKEINSSISNVLDHGQYIMGQELEELENKLINFSHSKYCISCSSGTDALLMVLMAWDVGPGDAVFTSSFSFISTAEVIKILGATPIFVDINPRTFTISCSDLNSSINKIKKENLLNPKCIIPVDIFGLPANYLKIKEIANRYNLSILGDGAQSFGSTINKVRTCTLSDATTTSFYPSKPLGCYGDGGAIFTDNKELCDKLISIRNHGAGNNEYKHTRIGLNGRLDTIQAAVLLEKLKIFNSELKNRQKIFKRYKDSLIDKYIIQEVPDGYVSTWAQFSIISREHKRQMVIDKLNQDYIPTAIHYPVPLHKQDIFNSDLILPKSEKLCKNIFSIPMHAYLDKKTQDIVINKLLEIS